MLSTLRFGIQKVAEDSVVENVSKETVRGAIDRLLEQPHIRPDLADQVRQALAHPHTIVELRSGKQLQTVGPDMPLREVLPAKIGAYEISISRPHVGG